MLSEFAPAKINLFLSIIKKREDGYHDIGTMFHALSCGDTLFGEQSNSGEIRLFYSEPQDYPSEKDLVYKAAIKLKEKYRVSKGTDLYLEKKLPLGAGLGGGSSDAAAALKMLNKLWGLKASSEELEKIGAEIGADVPFFIKGSAAFAEGIGDKLTSKKIDCSHYIALVATPRCTVPTTVAYSGVAPQGSNRWNKFAANFSENLNPLSDSFDLYNQFEETVLPAFPLIASLKQKLNNCGGKSLLSGSGASVFSLFQSLETAVKAYDAVKAECRFLQVAMMHG
ncbi:MAG: 4-(cytidine 5'-diphospho)-2-C-methyl-D-erythritol kinase [Fibromonadaceae bacterium]|jgi:4-diphosphocytidyl-2-C-methyl-D-erythritol kinase|nr:4-(cytidine 5'-diphospho)-2-C-methyl-D-erythritol kinase [Fibromonadaceae bacterium]